MAQATADLPDPDDLATAPLDDPDELVSQLAAEDIVRLLAETTTPGAGDVAVDFVPPLDIAAELDKFFSGLQSAPPAAPCRRQTYQAHTPWYLLPLVWIIQLVRISR